MLDGELVIDGVVHGFDHSDGNRAAVCTQESYAGFQVLAHELNHLPLESHEPGYLLGLEEFIQTVSADALAETLFLESDIDVAFYHHVPISGFFAHGVSRLDTGFALRALAPDRVYMYGGVDTFLDDRGQIFAQMEEFAEFGMVGFKFYPSNGIVDPEKGLIHMLYNDPEAAYPFFEKARELGVKHLAFHKSFPVGPSVEAIHPGDMLNAAVEFPDLTFEIVHAGWAFTEETAIEMLVAPNIYANLELSSNLVVRRPRQFAEMIGHIIREIGSSDRLIFASGTSIAHSDPVVRKMWEFEMPEDLVAGYGYPEITREMKVGILGGNMARMHGLDLRAIGEKITDDKWSQRRRAEGKLKPWGLRRKEAAAHILEGRPA